MSEPLDELFGEAGGQPEPRSTYIVLLIAGGLWLTLMGLACTSVPGGLIVLWAWVVVEKEMDRVESGYLPADCHPRVQRLHQATLAALVLVIGAFFFQAYLFIQGFYEVLWAEILQSLYAALPSGSA